MEENVSKDKPGNEEIKAELSTSAFEALEREFNEFLEDLECDPSLEKFRIEYEKLFRALKKSHSQEKRLVRKCRELNTEIVTNAAKVQKALKLSHEDQAIIASLKKDAEKAWSLTDAANKKELETTESINKLQDEIEELSTLVEKGKEESKAQENAFQNIVQECDDLKLQNEDQSSLIYSLQNQLREERNQRKHHEAEIKSLKTDLSTVTDNLTIKSADFNSEQKRRERMERGFSDCKSKLEKKILEYVELQYTSTISKNKVLELEKQLNDAKSTMEKYLNDYDALYQREQNLIAELKEQKEKNFSYIEDLQKSRQEMKICRSEQRRLTTEKTQLERKVDHEHNTVVRFEKMLQDAKTSTEMIQSEIQSLKREVEQYRWREEQAKREIDVLVREKNIHTGRIQRSDDKAKKSDAEAQHQGQIVVSLEKELAFEREECSKLRMFIRKLEHDRDRATSEATEQNDALQSKIEVIRLRDVEIQDMKTKNAELEGEIKQKNQLYNEVKHECNRITKKLIDSDAQVEELKKYQGVLNEQIKQFRDEVSSKDAELAKEHLDHRRERAQKDQYRNEISRMSQTIQQNEDFIHKQDIEVKRLASIIRRMDDDTLKQRKDYDQIIDERDILGTQLIRRNDQLALLYEKIKIQQNILRNGEMQYQARVEDIRLLKLKIKDLGRQVAIAKGGVVNVDGIARELIQMQRELFREKTKVKALSDELENPMNVHRWRKLEGSDPATYEMIQKIQLLQKRLIKKTEEVVEKEEIILEKEKLYLEIKKTLARQPGPDVAEQLNVYQSSLKEKARQMKAMASELNMYQTQINEYKCEIDRMTQELHDVKRKFYEQKKREVMARDLAAKEKYLSSSTQARQQAAAAQASITRYTGGGFAIK
mmetsp:Transcript_12374/g.15434  ORF Transcript_12374/g.15434 Transcript_12374/m.15434 type:complete len:883 (+) Transcript_12374:156-2804(+)